MHHYQPTYWSQNHSYAVMFRKMFDTFRERTPQPAEQSAKLARPARTDAQIAQDVKDELKLEPSVRADAVDVQVKDGVVTLKGVVDDGGEQWLIESAARRIAGVKSLSVQLKVFGPGTIATDDDIARDCERVLEGLVPSTDYTIRVMVSHGWVTLSGNVAEGYERRIAEMEVSSLLAVHGVNSQVKVRPAISRAHA